MKCPGVIKPERYEENAALTRVVDREIGSANAHRRERYSLTLSNRTVCRCRRRLCLASIVVIKRVKDRSSGQGALTRRALARSFELDCQRAEAAAVLWPSDHNRRPVVRGRSSRRAGVCGKKVPAWA
jgi:hypothetical protein